MVGRMEMLAAVAAVVVVGAIPAAEAGAVGFVGPLDGGTSGESVALSSTGAGDVAIAFPAANPTSSVITIRIRPGGGGLGAPAPASDPSLFSYAPAVASSPGGTLGLAFASSDADDTVTVLAATGSVAGGFGASVAIPGSGPDVDTVRTGVDRAGDQWVAWLAGPDADTLRVARRPAGASGFAAPTTVSGDVTGYDLAVHPDGEATLAWVRSTTAGDSTTTTVQRAAVGGAAATLQTGVETTDDDDRTDGAALERPRIAAVPGGASTVVWRRTDSDSQGTDDDDDDVVVTSLQAAPASAGAQALVTTTGEITDFDLAGQPDGAAVVAWDLDRTTVRAAVRTTGAFAPATTVAAGAQLSDVRAALAVDGRAVVAWVVRPARTLSAAIGTSGGFAPVAGLPSDVGVTDPVLDADDEGNVAAAWALAPGQVRVGAVDAAGPQLLDPQVPVFGNAGQTLGFGVSPRDSWSSVTGVSWDFGDGGTGTGATVQHAYAARGAYDVRISSADGVGNRSALSPLQVAVDQAPVPRPPVTSQTSVTDPAPVLGPLTLSARCVTKPTSGELKTSFDLSEAASVRIEVRRRAGSPTRRRCPTPGGTTPGRYETVGTRTVDASAGTQTVGVAHKARRTQAVRRGRGRSRLGLKQLTRSLSPGTYVVTLQATDGAGQRSTARVAKFWVLGGRGR